MPYQCLSKHPAFVGIADDGGAEDVGMAFGGAVMVERNSVDVPGFVSVIAGLS